MIRILLLAGITGLWALCAKADVPAEARRIVDHAVLSCENENSCVQGVGMIGIADYTGKITQCTAWLGSADAVVTNSHCVRGFSGDLKNAYIKFHYLDRTGKTKSIKVDRILFTTTFDVTQPDYAILKLKSRPSNLTPLPLSSEPLTEGQHLNPIVVNPTESGVGGRFERKSCMLRQESVIGGDAGSANLVLVGCSTRFGNSGAPIIDDYGKVRGIIQAGFDMAKLKISLGASVIGGAAPDLSYATNILCMDQRALGGSTPSAPCTPARFSKNKTLVQKYESRIVLDAVSAWLVSNEYPSSEAPFLYDFYYGQESDDEQTYRFLAVPKCLKKGVTPEQFFAQLRSRSGKSLWVSIPLLHVQTFYDQNYRPLPRVSLESGEMGLSESIEELKGRIQFKTKYLFRAVSASTRVEIFLFSPLEGDVDYRVIRNERRSLSGDLKHNFMPRTCEQGEVSLVRWYWR